MSDSKYIIKVLVFFIVLIISKISLANDISINKIAAVVDNDIITTNELYQQIILFKKQLKEEKNDKIDLQRYSLNYLIDTYIQLSLAEKNGIKISDTELYNIIKNMMTLRKMNIKQFKIAIFNEYGLSYEKFYEQLRKKILINKVQQYYLGQDVANNINKIEISSLIDQYQKKCNKFKKYHLVDILLECSEKLTKEQLNNKKKDMKNLIHFFKKRPFLEDKLNVKIYDQNIEIKDLGWRTKSELPNLFVSFIEKMNPGKVIGPIFAPNGFHLLKVLAINDDHCEKIVTKNQAFNIIFQQKLVEKSNIWLKDLKQKSYIKKYIE